jgi:peptide/nickel transport system permease protein
MRRLILLLPVLFGISVVVFAFIHLIPGDPVVTILGSEYTQETADALEEMLGLDKPLYIQYLNWLGRAVRGNLGRSIFPFGGIKNAGSGIPVRDLLIGRLPTTLTLTAAAMIISALIGVPLGVLTAGNKDSIFDNVARVLAVVGISMPIFWFGLLLILVFSINLRWLPPGGSMADLGLKVMIMPAVALGFSQLALVARMTRSTMLEILGEDYVRTARAKGLTDWSVLIAHALRNALIPVVTVIGLQVGRLLGGAVLTETIFNLPGLGRLLVESVYRRDYPTIQGCVLVIASTFVFVNLLVDILYAYLDPRVVLE